MQPKVIVAHPGQQHSYQLATALCKAGFLDAYVTTVYMKEKSLTRFVSTLLKGDNKKRAESRYCNSIPDEKVVQVGEVLGLLELLAMRIIKSRKVMRVISDLNRFFFEYKIAKIAIKRRADILICYNTNASFVFRILKKKAPNIKVVLDMAAANPIYMKTIYERDFGIAKSFSPLLKSEVGYFFDKKIENRTNTELGYADAFLVPSNFVMKSLEFSGVSTSKIWRCPYGVDNRLFSMKTHNTRNPIKFVYVGGVKELKGIYYLLEAFRDIPKEVACLTIVGKKDYIRGDIKERYSNVIFTGTLLHNEVAKILQQSDVFVFSSLGDSFSFAAMEAASTGLPLIVTENTGMCDGLTEGREGFIIPIQSIDAIKQKVLWFINNQQKIPEMGKKSHEYASNYTWERYYSDVINAVKEIYINENTNFR